MSDKSVVDQIKHYQRDIIKCPDNAKRMIRCIERLMVLPVTIAHLQETGVGRSVNELRKCGGEVGAAANALVCKWKSMVQAEEESDVDSEVEEQEPKESVEVSSPDREDSPPHESYSDEKHKSEPVDKYKKSHDHEENRKPKSDYPLKRNKLSHVENKSKHPDKRHSDKHDHRSHESKSSRSEHGSESDSKLSSSHRSKSGHDSRSSKKYHSSHRSESERNGEIKTDKSSSKNRHDETKSKKSNSSESQSKDVKQKHDKDKPQREDRAYRNEKENQRKEENFHKSVSSSNSSKKYDVRKIESESSDDDEVYKPRSKKRKKSESEEDVKHQKDKYSSRSKHTDSKRHQSSEESDAGNGSEDDENSQPSSRNSEKHHETDNEDESSNRSSPNNLSDNESESNRSYPGEAENENSNLSKASDSDESEASLERKIYVPTKIKKEKESPPRDSNTSSAKTVSDKSKSSHSHSSHSSSHNSSSHSSNKNDKVSSIKKGSSDCVKIKKEKEEHLDLKKKRDDKYNDKKSHKSGKPHSDSSKESNKNEKKVKIKVEKEDDGSIDCVSGASFADALLGLSEPKKKSAKRKSTSSPEKSSKSVEKPVDRKSKNFVKTEPLPSSSPASSSKTGLLKEPELLSKNIKLEPLDVDLKSTLPEISPHYKPLPHYSPPGSPPGKRTKMLSQEEALSTIMSTKNQRTKVYSGNKSGYLKVPSLFDLCIQVLRDNIEALEYTGGVPYDLLKPVLDRATAAQLFQLEHYNPYLVEDTDSLWKFHCNKDFRGKERDEFETWRELYVRLLDERERKLEALKVNISQSMAKNTPVRQTKLAYVDSVVKPPRNIAKKQMKFGTGKAVKHDLVSKALVGAASGSPATPAVPVPAPPASARSSQSSNAFPIPNFLKKKKAPLMQKALQLIKGNRFKR